MSNTDFMVPPMSWDEIGRYANKLRANFGLAGHPIFPVMDFLEEVLDKKLSSVHLLVKTKAEMPAAEGYTDPEGRFIILREDVYEKAWLGDPRARFTVAHECGHLFFHTGKRLLARAGSSLVAYRRAEPQANHFAAELLMPRRFIKPSDTTESIACRHVVSQTAAENRLNFMIKIGFKEC